MNTESSASSVAQSTAQDRQAPPATLVIFGAAGDLTKRLVVPALYNLVRARRLADGFSIIGVDSASLTAESWRKQLSDMMEFFVRHGGDEFHASEIDPTDWNWLAQRMSYLQGDFTDSETYGRLAHLLAKRGGASDNVGNVLFYLAVAERFFGQIVEQLGRAGLTRESNGAWRRVIIEKPFGHDLSSARALNAQILNVLTEDQIYRIDHFLGKETVQNILVLRFANGIFEPQWNRNGISHVQITAAETVGVEARGRFYEKTGALRDMVPNHLFQLLAMIAMEPPVSFNPDAVRAKKTELFSAIRPISPDDAVRGQYSAGRVRDQPVRDYRREPDVEPDSQTETYVALKVGIDNWRWAGVPFYLRTGKYLSTRCTEIALHFRQAPYALFRDTPVERLPPNIMTLRIQPAEGLYVSFSAKRPGPEIEIDGVAMDFCYSDYFEPLSSVGYETLIYDCFIGDATLFQRADTVEAAWWAVQPVLDAWAAQPPRDFPNYAAGSPGPEAADRLLQRDGHAWRPIGAGLPRRNVE
ncbi:glucose-6-phosphate dehydrogenase [Steroidobacter cummioxidans]|uniref:glucose-6-phosphate dehydrogenase n=1 Tax=Steroidobacter cummioxidans TaxID=1803913 RepID=UPI000E30BDA4|nr:glucose-6-phosphate dehydrogenase [Steroidobacter cummioxidans]